MIDLFSGFLFFFDQTRYLAMIFTGMFHTMNSQMFSIGNGCSYLTLMLRIDDRPVLRVLLLL